MTQILTTFVAPRPNAALIRMLEPVNRLFNLRGIPVLRDLPLLRCIPGIRGLTNIREIDFPAAEIARLRAVANRQSAAFLTPNHPEFFTDWMIDKEVMARLDITPGCWATHKVVNGMGRCGQKFWLANNLIAQIPGARGTAGKEHSITLAKRGDGVLLHPEGAVHWVADQIGPLYPGALEMAARTAADLTEQGLARPVFVAPLVYKYMFLRDESAGLHAAMRYLEQSLGLTPAPEGSEPARHLRHIYDQLTGRVAHKHGVALPEARFWDQRAALVGALTDRLDAVLGADAVLADDPYKRAELVLKRYTRARLARGKKMPPEARTLADDLTELLGLQPWMYPAATMTQEQVAERIQRLRMDWLKQRFKDRVHAFVPQPVGPRRAHIRMVEPLRITAGTDSPTGAQLRAAMQARLDDLNAEIAPLQAGALSSNPFLE